ncbi:hypothetical protein LRE75_08705 [Streptomyces sp. 372A]
MADKRSGGMIDRCHAYGDARPADGFNEIVEFADHQVFLEQDPCAVGLALTVTVRARVRVGQNPPAPPGQLGQSFSIVVHARQLAAEVAGVRVGQFASQTDRDHIDPAWPEEWRQSRHRGVEIGLIAVHCVTAPAQ